MVPGASGVDDLSVEGDLGDACAASDPSEQLRISQLLLAATFQLSSTGSTGEAADVVAQVACALTGATGAHIYLPDQLGGTIWSNVNTAGGLAEPGTIAFDINRDLSHLAGALLGGQDAFIADALAAGSDQRPLRERFAAASLLVVPLLEVGALVLWWSEQRDAPPPLSEDMRSFFNQSAQALRRRLETTTLRDLTVTDPLTRLTNRRGLMQELEQLPAHGALLLLDLDHFKRVNDTRGHRYGDQVLQAFSELLRDFAPEDSCVARWGGEEFAVVLPIEGRKAAGLLYSRLSTEWRRQGMTVSAGLAEHRIHAGAEETFEAADRALYLAKQSGRDQLVHAPNVAWEEELPPVIALPRPRRPLAARLELSLNHLDEALERELIRPHYQPVIDTRTGSVVAVEALARLEHPVNGVLLSPSEFLPLAERTGRVARIDALVAGTAIADVAAWRREGYDIAVGLNISVDHLDDPELPTQLLERCVEHGLDQDALIVEITETLQSISGRGHAEAIQRLMSAGVNVTLDDFGTGFSTLSYLLRFDVAGVKIDKSFTAALDTARGRHLVLGIIGIATSMGLHIVAEGVETTEQLTWLTEHGCPFAQGFLLSRPVPKRSLTAVMDHLNKRELDLAPT
ncbi:MAG: diguanylate cyclase/phosphodiesterase [Frankiales bacterium]|nr:diguanylate cyclase/phosphodiesterase [Frankiales bacterium]